MYRYFRLLIVLFLLIGVVSVALLARHRQQTPEIREIAFIGIENRQFSIRLINPITKRISILIEPDRFQLMQGLAWSKDGRWLVFTGRSDATDIYVLDMHTRKTNNLTSGDAIAGTYNAWSWQGNKLAFVLNENRVRYIAIYDADSGEISQRIPLEDNINGLAWTVDDQSIIYITNQERLKRLYLDDQTVELITPFPERIYGFSLSPDGQYAAVSLVEDIQTIKLINLKTRRQTFLLNLEATATFPDWSPTGDWLFFGRGAAELNIHRLDPSNPASVEVLAEIDGNEFNPHISPDGKWITFAGSDRRLYVMRDDGSDLDMIYQGSLIEGRAQWGPVIDRDWHPWVLVSMMLVIGAGYAYYDHQLKSK